MQIHINRDGEDFGPYTLEQVNQYLQDGSVVPTDMAWHDGQPDWVPLPQIKGVAIPGGGVAVAAAAGGGKKMVIGISIAAVLAAAITGGIVYTMLIKDKGGAGKQAASSGGGTSSSGGESKPAAGGGDGMGMDGDMAMGMDGDMAMGMDGGMAMGMDGGGGGNFAAVKAIFTQKCSKCHLNGKKKGGLSLDSKAGVMEVLKPGNPDGSLLVKLIRRDDPDEAMPPKAADALSKAELATVIAWVKAGAKWE
ncbi:MAG: mono/diheme cytochrome c family protein [Limisphaerales bacterium]|jgi:mono/diheme cytochrome c family protein